MESCVSGLRILFISSVALPSRIMRGIMPYSILNASSGRSHCAKVSYLDEWDGTVAMRMQRHFETHEAPHVCILVKFYHSEANRICHLRKARVLLDCVDNWRCSVETQMDKYANDAFIVQTHAHAAWLHARGKRAYVQPHPHGDHRVVRPKISVRPFMKSAGLVYAHTRNLPSSRVLDMICRACARLNMSFFLIWSQPQKFRMSPQKCVARTKLLPYNDSVVCLSSPQTAFAAPVAHETFVPYDSTKQWKVYEGPNAEAVRERIDVGILWPGSRRGEPRFAVENRPPTRMHWWFAMGLPVIGYPATAYLESAAKNGYPTTLLNLTLEAHVVEALRSIQTQTVRQCLDRIVEGAARRTSPQLAAFEMLRIACEERMSNGRDTQWFTSPCAASSLVLHKRGSYQIMTPRVGQRVFLEDTEYVGKVERIFFRTWGTRKGAVHSIQITGMDVWWRRIHIPGILYLSKGSWTSKLFPNAKFTVVE